LPRFVELWVYLSATPLFGLTATLVVYLMANAAYTRLDSAPWANPVLWSVVTLASGLLASGVDYPSYFAGAQFAVLTGMIGALSGKYLFDALRIANDAAGYAARGFSLGTAAHGIGAARALHVDADAGAYAGLALGMQVVLAALLMPLMFRLF